MTAHNIARDGDCVPLAFNSSVQWCRTSWTSSGATLGRAQASVHRCFVGAGSLTVLCCTPFLDFEGLLGPLPFSFEKKPAILRVAML